MHFETENTTKEEKTQAAHCNKHGPYMQRVREFMGARFRYGCSACDRERQDEEAARQERERSEVARRHWEAKLRAAAIPLRFRERTLSEYVANNDGQRRALSFAQSYARDFAAVCRTGRSAVFIGKPGTGKTHLAAGIALYVMQKFDCSVVFTTVQRAIRTVRDTWSKGSELTETEVVDELVFPDLLILDEVGVQYGSESEKILLFDILNERYERRLPSLLLSNLPLDQLRAYLGDRIMDRLREDDGEVLVFDWESARGRNSSRVKSSPVTEVDGEGQAGDNDSIPDEGTQ